VLAPETRLAAPPALPPACIIGDGRLGGGGAGNPAGGPALAGLGAALRLLDVGGGVGAGRVRSQRAGVYAKTPARFPSQPPGRVCHRHRAGDTLPVPAP